MNTFVAINNNEFICFFINSKFLKQIKSSLDLFFFVNKATRPPTLCWLSTIAAGASIVREPILPSPENFNFLWHITGELNDLDFHLNIFAIEYSFLSQPRYPCRAKSCYLPITIGFLKLLTNLKPKK